MKKFATILCVFCVITFSSCTESKNPSNLQSNPSIPSSSQVTSSPTIQAMPPAETPITSPADVSEAPSTETQGETLPEFNFDDWGMLGIRLGDSIETVISVLGEPERQETRYSPSQEENVTTCYYDFGHVSLLSYGVDNIHIDSPGYLGCRGIQVGDDIQSVLDKFPRVGSSEPNTGGKKYIYGDENSRNNAFLSIDILGNGDILTVAFLCGVRDGVPVSPVALRIDVNDDYVSAIRIFVVSV